MSLSFMLFIQYNINMKNIHIIWNKLDTSKNKFLNKEYLKQINNLDCKNILIKLIYNNLRNNNPNIDS